MLLGSTWHAFKLLFAQIHSEEFILKCGVRGDGGYMFDCMLVLQLRAFCRSMIFKNPCRWEGAVVYDFSRKNVCFIISWKLSYNTG